MARILAKAPTSSSTTSCPPSRSPRSPWARGLPYYPVKYPRRITEPAAPTIRLLSACGDFGVWQEGEPRDGLGKGERVALHPPLFKASAEAFPTRINVEITDESRGQTTDTTSPASRVDDAEITTGVAVYLAHWAGGRQSCNLNTVETAWWRGEVNVGESTASRRHSRFRHVKGDLRRSWRPLGIWSIDPALERIDHDDHSEEWHRHLEVLINGRQSVRVRLTQDRTPTQDLGGTGPAANPRRAEQRHDWASSNSERRREEQAQE